MPGPSHSKAMSLVSHIWPPSASSSSSKEIYLVTSVHSSLRLLLSARKTKLLSEKSNLLCELLPACHSESCLLQPSSQLTPIPCPLVLAMAWLFLSLLSALATREAQRRTARSARPLSSYLPTFSLLCDLRQVTYVHGDCGSVFLRISASVKLIIVPACCEVSKCQPLLPFLPSRKPFQLLSAVSLYLKA